MLDFQRKDDFMEKYLETLAAVDFFRGIEQRDLPTVLKKLNVSTKEYDKDDYIRHIKDPADFFGIVLDGSVQIIKDDYYGNRNITALLEKGAIFAEAFALAAAPFLPVDILSCENSVILFIPRDSILNTCGHHCQFHDILISNLLRIVAQKNIQLTQKLQYISHKTTREKLMAYLDEQARLHQSPKFTIPYNRQGLADYLGVERSAMSAEISKLAKEGYIETRRSYFKLLRSLV